MRDGRIVAVVPAFHPEVGLVDLVVALLRQVDEVVVVMDGVDVVSPELRAAVEAEGATVVDHSENRGIAAALNTGIQAASEPSAVLTVDQDSTVPDGYLQALRSAWARGVEAGFRVGLVAPERVTGIPSQVRFRRLGVALGRDPVQSGLLIPTATLRTVGEFDERLFIDGVDADYALRCLDAGLTVVVAEGVTLGHRLGQTHDVPVAGRTVRLTRSAAFRYYYLTRNRLWLVRRHARRHPRWAASQAFGLFRHVALVQTLVPERRARAAAVRRGIRDGFRR